MFFLRNGPPRNGNPKTQKLLPNALHDVPHLSIYHPTRPRCTRLHSHRDTEKPQVAYNCPIFSYKCLWFSHKLKQNNSLKLTKTMARKKQHHGRQASKRDAPMCSWSAELEAEPGVLPGRVWGRIRSRIRRRIPGFAVSASADPGKSLSGRKGGRKGVRVATVVSAV